MLFPLDVAVTRLFPGDRLAVSKDQTSKRVRLWSGWTSGLPIPPDLPAFQAGFWTQTAGFTGPQGMLSTIG